MNDARILSARELETLNKIALDAARPLQLDVRIEAFREMLTPEQRAVYTAIEDGMVQETAAIQAATWRAGRVRTPGGAGKTWHFERASPQRSHRRLLFRGSNRMITCPLLHLNSTKK